MWGEGGTGEKCSEQSVEWNYKMSWLSLFAVFIAWLILIPVTMFRLQRKFRSQGELLKNEMQSYPAGLPGCNFHLQH